MWLHCWTKQGSLVSARLSGRRAVLTAQLLPGHHLLQASLCTSRHMLSWEGLSPRSVDPKCHVARELAVGRLSG